MSHKWWFIRTLGRRSQWLHQWQGFCSSATAPLQDISVASDQQKNFDPFLPRNDLIYFLLMKCNLQVQLVSTHSKLIHLRILRKDLKTFKYQFFQERLPRFARTLSEKITGSCGMIEICWRSCFKWVVLVASPLTNISPDNPLLIRNNAEIRLLFPAPVRPTLQA